PADEEDVRVAVDVGRDDQRRRGQPLSLAWLPDPGLVPGNRPTDLVEGRHAISSSSRLEAPMRNRSGPTGPSVSTTWWWKSFACSPVRTPPDTLMPPLPCCVIASSSTPTISRVSPPAIPV